MIEDGEGKWGCRGELWEFLGGFQIKDVKIHTEHFNLVPTMKSHFLEHTGNPKAR